MIIFGDVCSSFGCILFEWPCIGKAHGEGKTREGREGKREEKDKGGVGRGKGTR